MKLRILYDGACPFCDDYVRYQELRAVAESVELVDARRHPEVLAEHGVAAADLEDGMVVIADGAAHRGADAVHLLSRLSQPPKRWWVRVVAAMSRNRAAARALYPFLKAGRRATLTVLRVPRFPK